MHTRKLPRDGSDAHRDRDAHRDAHRQRSSLPVRALADLQSAHQAVDNMFDYLIEHIESQDAVVRHLRQALEKKTAALEVAEARIAQLTAEPARRRRFLGLF